MSFISPQPCTTQVDEDGQCCPNTFIGFCLEDGTPISITMQAGAQLGWTNLLTGVFTSGPPPIGTAVCAVDQVAVALSCETHSITVCQNETAWDVSGSIVTLDAGTLASLETITVLQGTSPWVVSGTVTADTNFDYPEDSIHVSGNPGAFVLAVRNDAGTPLAADGDYIPFTTDATGALRVNATFTGDISVALDCATDSVTICPGDDPIVVTGTVELGATTLAALETITVNQGTSPWVIGDGGSSITVDAVDLDIRNLVFATDKIDVSGSVVALDAPTLAALETITVLQGTSPWVIGDGGGSITVDGTVAVTQSTSPWVTSLDAASLAALESITVQNGAGAAAVNIQDGGNSITVDGAVTISGTITTSYQYAEDSPHVSTNVGAFVLAVRNDAGTPLANDQDYIPFTTDATGALRVNAGTTVTQTGRDDTDNQASVATGLLTSVSRNYIYDGANWDRWTGAITDGGGSITVDGTVAVTQSTSPWVTSLDAASLAALESITVQNGAGAAAVNIQDGGNSITVDGTVSISGTVTTADDKVEDVPHVSGDTGSFVLGVRNDAAAALTNTNGDYSPIATDSAGRVGISDLGGSISIDDNAGSITVDGNVTVTQGTSPWITSLDAASLAALESITVQNGAGAAAVNIQDGGNSITVDGTVSITGTVTTADNKIEDAVHTTGDTGSFILAVRNDSNTTFTNTNGDYSPIAVNANGAVAINDGGNSITVDGTVAVTQSTSPWVVSGTVTANQGTSPWVTSLDAASLAALESITVQNPGGASAVNIQDGGNSITVDGAVTVSGTVATNSERAEDSGHTSGQTGNFVLGVRNDAAATLTSNDLDYTPFATDAVGRIGISDLGGSISIDDNAGSITVDGIVAATQSGAWSVTVLNGAGVAAVNIQDGGNSITVDGTVSISGTVTVDTELPAASALADADPSPTTSRIGANNLVFNGTTWDRVRAGTATGSILVNNPTAANFLATVSIDAASLAALESITVQNGAGASAVNIQDGGNSITVDGTVSISGTVAVTQSTSPWVVAEQSGTLVNGSETAVSSAAVQILASNANRRKLVVQNTGTANIRVGITGVTNTTGSRIVPNGTMLFEMPNCPTNAIFAIREGAIDSVAFAQEII